ncbi:MAG: AAA family ATPase [Flavobacteriales bacterium]|nr:AAA family ATPase [Flavobacteriales bacterium]
MIRQVHIRNFKTLKDLRFSCTRMNLFIGDTNTGKSNILEALTLFSRGALRAHKLDQRLIRYDRPEDLFTLRDLSEPISVDIGSLRATLAYNSGRFNLEVEERKTAHAKPVKLAEARMDAQGTVEPENLQFTTYVRRYQYFPDTPFGPNAMKELEPPDGPNLPGLLASNKELRTRMAAILERAGLRLEVNLSENTIRLSQLTDDHVVVTLPYRNLSDTIKRYLFMYAVLETVKGFSLLFDEPEQNTFPFYTKHMAEMMALDNGNQYFITTHNPYLFRSVVEKTLAKDLSVFITHLNIDGATQLKRLNQKELSELLDMDVFFNIQRFLEP